MIIMVIGFSIILIFMVLILINNAMGSKVDNESYFFANRSLNQISLGFTLMATQVGGGVIVGICDAAFESGLMGYCYALGQMLGLGLVYLFFSRSFQELRLQTTSEIFTKIYQSTRLRKSASLLSVFSLGLILVAQAVAIKKLFIAMGITSSMPLCLLWGGVVAYTALGGFSAVVKTDVVQILLIFIGLILLGANIPIDEYRLVATELNMDISIDFSGFLNYIIWPCCYVLIEQDMVQRFGASKCLKTMRRGILISLVGYGCIAILPLVIGLLANLQNISINTQSSVLIAFSQTYLPAWVANVTIFILLMAILSTVDSLLCALSSLISCDKLITLGQGQTYIKNSLITFTMGFLALAGGLFFESVLKLLVFAYGLTACALFVPVFIGILGWSKNTKAASFAMFAGVISYAFFAFIDANFTIAALIFSGLGFILGLSLERYQRKDTDLCFNKRQGVRIPRASKDVCG